VKPGRVPGATPAPGTDAVPQGIALRRSTLILLVAAWLVAAGNIPFWRAVWPIVGGTRPGDVLFVLSLPLAVLAWTHLLLLLLAWGRATRPVLAVVLLVSAAATYFTGTYGVLLDEGMLANIAQTHAAEALDLVTWRLGAWLLAFGGLPAVAIWRIRMAEATWTRELGAKALHAAAAIGCLGTVLLAQYPHYITLAHNHHELGLMLAPHNLAASLYSRLRRQSAARIVLEPVGTDATRAIAVAHAVRPMLTVLVVGETARAANFSLNGYPRTTNPELARQNVINFRDVSACGTSTAVSLPCMFLDVGRAGFDTKLAQRREGLLDVLQHAGIEVHWLDNNSGCKGACNRVPHEDFSNRQVPGLCSDGECYDGILVHGLQAHLNSAHGDAVIVLHMKGSHGPAYYKRYPPSFEAYTPVCRTAQLDSCTQESIVNTYDNTLRYTDHVLSEVIDLLRAAAGRFDTALLYVSDHGESLGENGLYLHGIPYALAPREQTHVPMLLWLSAGLRDRLGIDTDCLEHRQGEPLSHDNVYHSLLGLSNVRTAVYRPERDLLRPCRS